MSHIFGQSINPTDILTVNDGMHRKPPQVNKESCKDWIPPKKYVLCSKEHIYIYVCTVTQITLAIYDEISSGYLQAQ